MAFGWLLSLVFKYTCRAGSVMQTSARMCAGPQRAGHEGRPLCQGLCAGQEPVSHAGWQGPGHYPTVHRWGCGLTHSWSQSGLLCALHQGHPRFACAAGFIAGVLFKCPGKRVHVTHCLPIYPSLSQTRQSADFRMRKPRCRTTWKWPTSRTSAVARILASTSIRR